MTPTITPTAMTTRTRTATTAMRLAAAPKPSSARSTRRIGVARHADEPSHRKPAGRRASDVAAIRPRVERRPPPSMGVDPAAEHQHDADREQAIDVYVPTCRTRRRVDLEAAGGARCGARRAVIVTGPARRPIWKAV